MQTVYVGMSGGVDSSVSALLLKEQGYNVVGIYMKNWSKDLPGMKCPWADDLADAKRVAVKLGIPFEVWDFEKEYREKVVEYMLREFKAGNTPNPDIMCNQEIKFKLFYKKAMAAGADFIATGHYARVGIRQSEHDFLGTGSARPIVTGEPPLATSVVTSGAPQKACSGLPQGEQVLVRLRHRAPLVPAIFDGETIHFDSKIKRPASGQSAVLYDGEICIGGGIIA